MSAEIFNFSKIYDYDSYQKYASKHKVKLGWGINGTVYKVWINNAFPIAVKEINLDEEEKVYTKEIAALKSETDQLMNMNHQHIMKVYFRFSYINEETNERLYYIGMELAPTDLEKVLKKQPKLSQYEISQLASQIASALEYLELKKVAHRDLKPANILVTENGQYKLCDFSEYKWYEQTVKTTQNTLKGTPSYLSPELKQFFIKFQDEIDLGLNPCNKLNYDAFKSDVFSFGIILLQCHGVNIKSLNSKEGELKAKINDNCTTEMKWLLEKCLAFNPKNRFLFKEISQYLRLDIIQASYQLMSLFQQQQKQRDELNQLKSQEILIQQQNQQIENDNIAINQFKKERQLQSQEIQKLNDQIAQLKQTFQSQSFQPLNSAQPVKKNKDKKEIFAKCQSNQQLWKNQNQEWRKDQFTKNAKGLKWNDYYYSLNHDDDDYDDYDDHASYHVMTYWNDKTGQKLSYNTYWRYYKNGNAWAVCDQDIPKAIEIVNKIANVTGYEFGLCLMMLHSNLWNQEKSVNDLMY